MGTLNTQDNPATTIAGVTAGSITAAVIAILVFVQAFGWYSFTQDQYAAVTAGIAALWAVVIPMALAIKGIAYAPSTVAEIKQTLVDEDPNTPLTPQATAALAK